MNRNITNSLKLGIALGILSAAGFSSAQRNLIPQYSVRIVASGITSAVAIDHGQVVGTAANAADIWMAPGSDPVTLSPSGYMGSAHGARNGWQVGNVVASHDMPGAVVWHGDAGSATYLTHGVVSDAFDVSNSGVVVGYKWVKMSTATYYAWHPHSYVWYSDRSGADLNPVYGTNSHAYGISPDGLQVVGEIDGKAALWSGSSFTLTDLSQPLQASVANCVSNGWQAGQSNYHATLWRGTASSAIDLNPIGATSSTILAIAATSFGLTEAGSAYDSTGLEHAIVWKGSANSAIDLNRFLPTGYRSARAYSVDANGDIAGTAISPVGAVVAVVWQSLLRPIE